MNKFIEFYLSVMIGIRTDLLNGNCSKKVDFFCIIVNSKVLYQNVDHHCDFQNYTPI